MQSNFSFLDEKFPDLANLGRKAEAYLYADNNSCLMKLGMVAENVVKRIFAFDRLTPPADNSAATRINALRNLGLIDQSLCDILHDLRKARNRAIHENWSSVSKGKLLLQMGHSLCQWFMQVYGDSTYQPRAFVMPPKPTKPEKPKPAPDKAKEEAEEKAMAKAAEEAAAAAPAVPMAERRARAGSAASQRLMSEAEVRERIDQQLRRAGWEADTEALRYAKGVRPAKGRNLAIAEWPVTLPSGETGRADYALFVGTRLLALIEAKAAHVVIPSALDAQCREYARGVRTEDAPHRAGTWGEYGVPFVFAANGRPYVEQLRAKSGIWSLDLRDPTNEPRALRGWPSPQGLIERLERDINAADRELEQTPLDLLRDPEGLALRPYQVRAVQAVERAVMEGRRCTPRRYSARRSSATATGRRSSTAAWWTTTPPTPS